MRDAVVLVGLLAVSTVVGLGGLTAVGASKRGAGTPLALLEGLVFPLAWVAWYARDRRSPPGRTGVARLPEA